MEVCSDQGLKRQKDQLLLSDYLHCLGVILHYRNDPHLRDFIILNPQWAVDAVYSVLSDDRVKKAVGRFDWKFL
jgi:internalin A